MSKEAITKVVQRAISDAGFRRQLSTDPTGALRGFDLSAAETAALRAGDAGRLSALGVDQRMSKAFVLGGATVGASRTAGSDLSNASSVIASDPSGAAGDARGNALVSGNLSESDAMISDGGASMRGVIPTDPHIRNTDTEGGSSSGSLRAISDDPDGFLAASEARASGESGAGIRNTDTDGGSSSGSLRGISDDPDGFLAASAARASGEPGAAGSARAINDDPDGFLAASDARAAAEAESATKSWINDDPDNFLQASDYRAAGEPTARASAINDDPDGFLAANAKADVTGSASGTPVEDSEGYLTSVGYDASVSGSAAVSDAHDRGDAATTMQRQEPNAWSGSEGAYNAPTSAVSDAHDRGDRASTSAVTDTHDRGGGNVVSDSVAATSSGETAFLDDSESYLSPIGTDSGASTSAVTDAHDRGDDLVTRIADDDDASGSSAASENGPNIDS